MKTVVLKVSRIGNSRGIRLPKCVQRKLSWLETAAVMAEAREDWSEWETVVGDGV